MHVLKNILIPIVTVIGLRVRLADRLRVVTETVFAWPGMGKLLIDSINVLDRPVIVAYLLVIVVAVRRASTSSSTSSIRCSIRACGWRRAAADATAIAGAASRRAPRAPRRRRRSGASSRDFVANPARGRSASRCSC